MLDPKVFLLLATGTLLLLNGIIARSAAAKKPRSEAVDAVDAPAEDEASDGKRDAF